MNNKLVVVSGVFILGLLFCLTYKSEDIVEGFNVSSSQCPDMLIKKGKQLHLMNSKKAIIPLV